MDTKCYDVIDPDFSQPDYLPPCDGGGCRPCPPPPRPLPPCRPPKPGCTSNSTPWYGLPQWAAGDVTSWLMQMNGAMLRIDTIMHDLALRTGINGLPDDLVGCVAKLSQDMEVVKCTIGEMSNKQANIDLLMQNLNTQFSAMKTDVASLTLSVTNLDTRIMTVDSKADGMKNDIVLLKTDLNMLSKTVQNLTANFTSFQNAVNESIAELKSGVLTNANDISALGNPKFWNENHSTEFELVDTKSEFDISTMLSVIAVQEAATLSINKDIMLLVMRPPRIKIKKGEGVTDTIPNNARWIYGKLDPTLEAMLTDVRTEYYPAGLVEVNGTDIRVVARVDLNYLQLGDVSEKHWYWHIQIPDKAIDELNTGNTITIGGGALMIGTLRNRT